MRAKPSLVVLVGLTLLSSCVLFEPKETIYLRSAEGRASQREVEQHLGAPVYRGKSPDGQQVWVYHVRELQPGNRTTPTGAWCDEYLVRFDDRGVVKDWAHRSHFHGGEVMPTACVPGGFTPS
jgi:hypothetical protein